MEAAPDDDLLGFGQSHAFDEIDEKLPAGKGAVEKLLNPLHRPILNGDLWGLPDSSLFPPAQSNVRGAQSLNSPEVRLVGPCTSGPLQCHDKDMSSDGARAFVNDDPFFSVGCTL